jgi:hypothetical protein
LFLEDVGNRVGEDSRHDEQSGEHEDVTSYLSSGSRRSRNIRALVPVAVKAGRIRAKLGRTAGN